MKNKANYLEIAATMAKIWKKGEKKIGQNSLKLAIGKGGGRNYQNIQRNNSTTISNFVVCVCCQS